MDAPRRRHQREPISTINVTPLVDVMLVLLIVFMVTISLQQQGIGVDLPAVRSDALANDADIIVVSIDRNRQVFINDQPIDRRQLPAILRSRFEANKPKTVYLKSDRAVSYGDFVAVIGLIKEAGVEHLSMITEPPEK